MLNVQYHLGPGWVYQVPTRIGRALYWPWYSEGGHGDLHFPPPLGLISPNPGLPTRIQRPLLIHPAIPQPQTRHHCSHEETTRRTGEIAGWIALLLFTCLPNPLRNNLPDAGARIVQGNRERNRQQAGRVARNPVCHGRGRGKSTTRSETQTPITLDVGVVREQASSKPADAADH